MRIHLETGRKPTLPIYIKFARDPRFLTDEKLNYCHKLIITNGQPELYNMKDDLSETKNLVASQPERVQGMLARWKEWNKGNKPDLWEIPEKTAYQYASYEWLKGSQHYKAKSK